MATTTAHPNLPPAGAGLDERNRYGSINTISFSSSPRRGKRRKMAALLNSYYFFKLATGTCFCSLLMYR